MVEPIRSLAVTSRQLQMLVKNMVRMLVMSYLMNRRVQVVL